MSKKKYVDDDYADQLYTTLFEGLQLATPEQRGEIEILRELLIKNLAVVTGVWPEKSEESISRLFNYARWGFHLRMRLKILISEMKGKEVNEEVAEMFTIPWDEEPFASALAEHMEKEGAVPLSLH